MNIRNLKSIILIILFFLIQCTSSEKPAYNNKNSYNNTTQKAFESDDKIDRWKTYEIFFKLSKDEECININLSSQIFDEAINKNINFKTYFIVEKAVDISKFISDKKIVYSEIGNNFDNSWNTKQEIEIRSSEMDPIKKLKNSSTYRIRFTTFRDLNFNFSILIFSKNSITLTEKKPDFAN